MRSVGALCLLFAWVCLGGCKQAPTTGLQQPAAYCGPAPKPATADEFWTNALVEVYKSPLELRAQHETEVARGLHFAELMKGDPRRREIAITFDDGPHPEYTPKLLEILARYKARATFFVVGTKAEENPCLIQAEYSAGHSIANHTYHHVNLTRIPSRLVAVEITACGDVLKKITGEKCHLFRPPGGDYNRPVAETANDLGYTLVLWTINPGDYASPGKNVIEERTLARLANGGIILIHDGVQQTVDILPQLLEILQKMGFKFVTVDEMMRS
jgi:peptidoglycan/xylan/chitin deacetylase (PgdA/CDA1 family)